jgi:hypothetical protein
MNPFIRAYYPGEQGRRGRRGYSQFMTLPLGMRWNYTEMEEMETLNEAMHQSF